jgi:hypothetical protein
VRGLRGAARGPLPPPISRERYLSLALDVLRACIGAPWAPPGFDEGCRHLWLKFQATRTIPSGDEFEADMEQLYTVLRDAGIPDGVYIGADRGETLLRAKHRLDAACEHARSIGLVAATDDDDRPGPV